MCMFVAADASFTSFIPEEQLPLTLPLREAVNVEISIVQPSPDPTLSLRVRDCFAYPGSRHSVWTLLYDGYVINPHPSIKKTKIKNITAQFCPFCTDVQILRIIWEALSLWTNRGRPHLTHKSGGLMLRPLPSWTPAQAIQVQRKYVLSDYNISATQCFVFFPQTWLCVFSHSDVLLLLGGNLHEWRWLRAALYLHLWVYHSTLDVLFIFGIF